MLWSVQCHRSDSNKRCHVKYYSSSKIVEMKDEIEILAYKWNGIICILFCSQTVLHSNGILSSTLGYLEVARESSLGFILYIKCQEMKYKFKQYKICIGYRESGWSVWIYEVLLQSNCFSKTLVRSINIII
jgi:hypothetical protein